MTADVSTENLAADAQAILDGQEESLPGLEAETKVSILGAAFATNEQFVLGERVELKVVGFVGFAGDQLIENEGKRRVVKINTTLIQVVDTGDEG